MVAALRAAIISSSVMDSSSSKNFSIKVSSYSATASTNKVLYLSTSALSSSGMGISLKVIPESSSFQIIAFFEIKSTTPLKSISSPIGTCKGTGFPPSISFTCLHTLKKSDP